jgi:GNAT superfamily N-acetyltransferase
MTPRFQIASFDFDEAQIQKFIDVAWVIYANDKNWTPPDRQVTCSQLSARYPFYNHGVAQKFIAFDRSTGEPCGRVAAIINYNLVTPERRTGHVGFFECVDNHDVSSALLGAAFEFLASRGINQVVGPMNYSTLYNYRLLTKGHERPPFYTDVYNPAYYPELFHRFGFSECATYYSDIDEHTHEQIADGFGGIHRRLTKMGFTSRLIDMSRFDEELELIHYLTMESFQNNVYFSKMDVLEFRQLYAHYARRLRPEHWRIGYAPDGQPTGFFLSFPEFCNNYPNAYLTKMVGVLPRYRRFGVAAGLAYEAMKFFIGSGFKTAIAPLRIKGNPSLGYGAGRYQALKEYTLYSHTL